MPKMKEVADMRPDETSKIFSHVEEKTGSDNPSTISINDSNKADSDPTSFPDHRRFGITRKKILAQGN